MKEVKQRVDAGNVKTIIMAALKLGFLPTQIGDNIATAPWWFLSLYFLNFSFGTNEDFIFFLSRRIINDLSKLLCGELDFNKYTLEISFEDSIASIIGRNSDGSPLIDASGSYTSNNDTNYKTNQYALIGDSNPDFVANIANSISYGNVSFNFLFNATIGGDMYSSYMMTLLGRGQTIDTVDRELPYVLPGRYSSQIKTEQKNYY